MPGPGSEAEVERAFEATLAMLLSQASQAPGSVASRATDTARSAGTTREFAPDLARDLLLIETDAARLAAHLGLQGTEAALPARATDLERAREQDTALRMTYASATLEEYLLRRSLAGQTFAAGSNPERTLRARARRQAAEASPPMRAVLLARAIRELEWLPVEPRFYDLHPSRTAAVVRP